MRAFKAQTAQKRGAHPGTPALHAAYAILDFSSSSENVFGALSPVEHRLARFSALGPRSLSCVG
jgi:hypothetical protein